MAGGENILLSVETSGIDKAVDSLKTIVDPLKDLQNVVKFLASSDKKGHLSVDIKGFDELRDTMRDVEQSMERMRKSFMRHNLMSMVMGGGKGGSGGGGGGGAGNIMFVFRTLPALLTTTALKAGMVASAMAEVGTLAGAGMLKAREGIIKTTASLEAYRAKARAVIGDMIGRSAAGNPLTGAAAAAGGFQVAGMAGGISGFSVGAQAAPNLGKGFYSAATVANITAGMDKLKTKLIAAGTEGKKAFIDLASGGANAQQAISKLTTYGVEGGILMSLRGMGPVLKGIGAAVGDVISKVGELALSFAKAHALAIGLTGGIAAITAGSVLLAKSAWDDQKAFAELNPEIETCSSLLASAKQNVEDVNLAFKATSGKIINDELVPAFKALTEAITNSNLEYQKLKNLFLNAEFDAASKTAVNNLKQSFTDLKGVTALTLSNLKNMFFGEGSESLQNAADEAAKTSAEIQSTKDAIFKSSQTGQIFEQQLDKVRQKSKAVADETGKTEKSTKNIANTLKELDFTPIFNWQVFDGKTYTTEIYNKIGKLKDEYRSQMSAIDELDGSEDLKNALRLKKEEEYQKQLHDLELDNARQTGDDLLLMQDQYDQIKKQKDQESLVAFNELQAQMASAERARLDEMAAKQREIDQQRNDYVKMFTDNISGTLTSSITSFFDAALEGNADLRASSYDLFMSLAKNIFNMGITKLVTYAIEAMMGQYEANSKYGLAGLAIATGASGILAGILAGMKSKLSPAKIQYQTGGYISNGMVRGAYSSGDSVEALLQPGERVLSKEETKAYDRGMSYGQQVIFNITVNSQLSTQADVDRFTRQTLVPAFRRAAIAGYKA